MHIRDVFSVSDLLLIQIGNASNEKRAVRESLLRQPFFIRIKKQRKYDILYS